MSSSSTPKESPRRRKKQEGRNINDAFRNKMAITESKLSDSPFVWRKERTSSNSKKSHGIPPSRFHTRTTESNNENEKNGRREPLVTKSKQISVPEWKEQIERNLLVQEQKTHMKGLEEKRKCFRRITQLKTWPLQDMAMEHLDHLLGKNSHCQFHGGDYLSAESSSSVSSVESSKPRLLPRSKTTENVSKTTKAVENENGTTKSDGLKANGHAEIIDNKNPSGTNTETNNRQKLSPLWSLEPRIFATEKGSGKRKYLVGEFGRIADWYWRKTEPTSRHLYEVIREGSPCRLYFDLEFSRVHNPSIPTVQLLEELEDELATELRTHFGSRVPKLRSSQIINLDSSNDSKFSRHWIVHLVSKSEDQDESGKKATRQQSEFLFKDAPTVGRFIKRMVGRLAEEIGVEGEDFAKKRPALAKHLFVNTKDPNKQTCFIDLGVYTRNRLFRCLGSSKKGKTTTLKVVLSENDQVETTLGNSSDHDHSTKGVSKRKFFPLNLPVQKETSIVSETLNKIQSIEDFIVANDWGPYAQALADSLVVPLKDSSARYNYEGSGFLLEVDKDTSSSDAISNFTGSSQTISLRKYPATVPMARQGSPLPSLDQYVLECLGNRGGTQGSIRAWSIEYGSRDAPISFTYHMQRNRFCEIIGRSHKSNNIFWTIDLTSWTCIQGCHDPDCYGRGCPIPITNDGKTDGKGGRLDVIKQEYEAWQEEEFEKALMALNIDDVISTQASERATSSLSCVEPIVALNNANKDSTDTSDELSDDALLQAVLDNPELFP